jgi:hypothetical protein
MKKIDKIKNIQKANLIAEQLYLENKGLLKEETVYVSNRDNFKVKHNGKIWTAEYHNHEEGQPIFLSSGDDKIKGIVTKVSPDGDLTIKLGESSITEISADLKRKAFKSANDKFEKTDYDTAGLDKSKYAQQADKFLSHVNPEIEKFIKDRAAAFNLKVGVEKKIESYHDTEVIYLYFLPSTDTSTGSYEPNYSNNLFSVGIMKNNYKLNKDNSLVEIPKNFDRALLQIIKVIQDKEISNETKGSVEI